MVSMMNPMVYVRNQPEAPTPEPPKQPNMMGFPFQQGRLLDKPKNYMGQCHIFVFYLYFTNFPRYKPSDNLNLFSNSINFFK